MKTPEWLKPALGGAVAGAVAISIVGFSWGGWVTGGKAQKMARDHAKAEVVAALVPVCVAQARADPDFETAYAKIEEARSYSRRGIVEDSGWATMPGSTTADRSVAAACLGALEKANAGA